MRTGAAFSVPEFRVAVTKGATDHLSVHTMELLVILLAPEWVEEVEARQGSHLLGLLCSTDELKFMCVSEQTGCFVQGFAVFVYGKTDGEFVMFPRDTSSCGSRGE